MKAQQLIFFIIFCGYGAQDSPIIDILVPPDGSTTPDTRSSADPLVLHSSDSSIPQPTKFAWSVRGNARPLVYDVFLSEDKIFDTADLWVKGYPDTLLPLWNLKIGTRYYLKISARDDQNNAWESQAGSFTTCPAWPRMLYIDGTTNVRDIGGRKTAEGRLIPQGIFYRSAEFNTGYVVTEKGMEQLKLLGIVCELDLRKAAEDPHPVFPPPVHYVNPVDGSGNGIYQYQEGLISTAGLYRDVFKEIADSQNYPMACHCRGGADRTATVVAMIEAIIGCSEQQMGEDYQWTSLSVFDLRDTTLEQWKGTMAYLKSFDEQNGDIQVGTCNYLLKQGLTVDELISIRKIFVGDDSIPFPLSIKRPAQRKAGRFRPTIVEKVFTLSPLASITMTKGVKRASLFNCQGKKIREYIRRNSQSETKVKVPGLTAGAYIVRFVNDPVFP